MLELIGSFLIGIVFGIVSGLLPGINIFVSLTILYPILLHFDPVNILIVYITITSINQYYASVSATVFAMPASSSAMPALIEGHELFNQGKGDSAIMYAAIGSFFASLLSMLMIILFLPALNILYQMFTTQIQIVVLTLASVLVIIFSQNKIYSSAGLFALGNWLAYIGYRQELRDTVGTFGLDILSAGVPIFPVIISLFVFPILYNSIIDNKPLVFKSLSMSSYKKTFQEIIQNKFHFIITRSSLIGSLAGFVPGISFVLSTILAYNYEKHKQKKAKTYKKGNLPCLIAAESANNAGAYTQFVPLLLLGIPITASSALVYNLLLIKGLPVDVDFFQSTYEIVTIFFLFSSIIGLVIAGKYVNFLKVFNGFNPKLFYILVAIVLILATYISGQYINAGGKYLILLFFLLPLGYALRNFDNMPLVFGMILHDVLFSVYTRIAYFYF